MPNVMGYPSYAPSGLREKIMIGVPGFAGIQPEAQEAFMRMVFRCGRDLPQYDFAVQIITKSEQFRARNRLVDMALAADCTYLLMLDDDMIVPHDLISRLMAHGKDIVGALYWQRGGSFHPVIMRRTDLPQGGFHSTFYAPNDDIIMQQGLHEVDIIGGGCMLFKVDIFRQITPPYFWWEHTLGTDIAICTRFKEAGVPIFVDTSIELGHIGNRLIITRDEIPVAQQTVGAMKEQVLRDAREYLKMSAGEIESACVQASELTVRQEHWNRKPRETWEQIREFYTTEGDWHILNLLFWALQKNTSMVQWILTSLAGKLKERRVVPSILDLGPGIGIPSFHLAQVMGCEVVMADIEGAPTLDFGHLAAPSQHFLNLSIVLYSIRCLIIAKTPMGRCDG